MSFCHNRPCIASAFDPMAVVAEGRLKDLKPNAFANAAWAFAAVRQCIAELVEAVAEVDKRRLKDFDSQGSRKQRGHLRLLAMHHHVFLCDCRGGENRLDTFTTQSIAKTVWACATAGHALPELFEESRVDFSCNTRAQFGPLPDWPCITIASMRWQRWQKGSGSLQISRPCESRISILKGSRKQSGPLPRSAMRHLCLSLT